MKPWLSGRGEPEQEFYPVDEIPGERLVQEVPGRVTWRDQEGRV